MIQSGNNFAQIMTDHLSCYVLICDLIRSLESPSDPNEHDDVIKWKHFPRYWPFVRGIHRSPVNSPHKGQWRGALMFSLIWAWIHGWVNNRGAGDLGRHRAHYDITVMISQDFDDELTPFDKKVIDIMNSRFVGNVIFRDDTVVVHSPSGWPTQWLASCLCTLHNMSLSV